MKNLVRLLMAVVALFAYSCVTDATEDLGVQLDKNAGQTTLTISLEGTKTHIGAKAEDVYPLYWSEGDQIAINGVASHPLTEAAHGSASAEFIFDGELAYPYNLVYPAPAPEVVAAEGLQAVTFLATQKYTPGTFAEGAAPLYAYTKAAAEGEEQLPIEIKHLSGVLCFVPQGDVTLTSMTVTSSISKLAGNFDLNCQSGKLTAHEDATDTITVDFGEGLALSAEGTPIYVAVPAGEHGTIAVTLRTATDAMLVKFSSYDNGAIKAGVVREFAPFVYAATEAESEEFLITTKEDLIRFAQIAETFYPRTTAKLAGQIDMTGVEWTPIENFANYTFDGNKGNGCYIKGLSAPLFAITEAKIKDLKLVDVDMTVSITSTDNNSCGAIACRVNNGTLVNCEATGKLVINYSTHAGFFGGLAGVVSNTDFTNNVNHIDITVNGSITDSKEETLRVGGVLGVLISPTIKVEKCYNYGDLVVAGDIDRISGGGLIGFTDAPAQIEDCHNEGFMHLAANVNGTAYSAFTGFVGQIHSWNNIENQLFSATNCTNRGNVLFGTPGGETVTPTAGKSVQYVQMSGMIGYTRNVDANPYTVKLNNCQNYGNVEVNAISCAKAVKVSGIMSHVSCHAEFKDCTNYGKIAMYNGIQANPYTGAIINHIQSEITEGSIVVIENCTNEGEIYISDKITNAGVPYLGGLTSYIQGPTEVSYKNSHNKGDITYNFKQADNSANVYAGAITGYVNSSATKYRVEDCSNSGALTYNVTMPAGDKSLMYLGGLVGHLGCKDSAFEETTNSGNLLATGICQRVTIGGFVGSIGSGLRSLPITNCVNSGNITYENKQESNPMHLWVAGFTGVCLASSTTTGYTPLITLTSCENSGDITVKNTSVTGQLTIGGLGANVPYKGNNSYHGAYLMVDCINSGDILCEECYSPVDLSVGGLLSASSDYEFGESTFKAPINTGNITVKHTDTDKTVHMTVGGIVGDLYSGTICKNDAGKRGYVKGNITINSSSEASSSTQYRCVGGAVGFTTKGDIQDLDILSEDTSINLILSTIGANVHVGGAVGCVNSGSCVFKNITNNAPVNATIGTMSSSSYNVYIGGVTARIVGAVKSENLTNYGKVTVESTTNIAGILSAGGIFAVNTDAVGQHKNLVNNGEILIKKGKYANIYLGGISGGEQPLGKTTNYFEDCTNNGKITLEDGVVAAGNIRMGGCFGWTKGVYDKNIRNNGDIYVGAKTSGSNRQILFGGVYSYNSGTTHPMTGGYINTGDITITGGTNTSTNGFGTTIGGIVGAFYGELANAVNVGNIYFSGVANTANSNVGGIVGYSQGLGIIHDCKTYCDIQAYIPKEDGSINTAYPNAGFITGSLRIPEVLTKGVALQAVVRNCQLGGTWLDDYDGSEEQFTGKKINSSNFHNYIYGGDTDWTNVADYDGCTLLTSKPKID